MGEIPEEFDEPEDLVPLSSPLARFLTTSPAELREKQDDQGKKLAR